MSKWSSTKKEEFKLGEESANGSVREILDFYHLDVDEIEDKNQKSQLESSLNKLATAYRRGALENKRGEKGLQIVQHLASGDSLTYEELQGKHKVAMDGLDQFATTARQHALLGSLCGLGSDAIKALHGIDLSVAECLAFVFFMV